VSYTPPFCKVCQNNHGLGAPHIWEGVKVTTPKSVPTSVANKPGNNVSVKESVTNRIVNNAPIVTNGVTNKKEQGKLRAAKWRENHRASYNFKMKEVMRTLRAK